MDHSLVSRVLTSFYEGRQLDLQHFRRNPLQAYLHVLAILTQVIVIIQEAQRAFSLEVQVVRSVCGILIQDAIGRFGRPAICQGTENRPQVLNIYRSEPLTEALLDEEFSDSD